MRYRLHIFVPPGPAVGGVAIYPPVIPRGALQIARAARSIGWDVEVTDGYSYPEQIGQVRVERVQTADIVGISVHGAPNVPPALELIGGVRAVAPTVPIIVGGNLATVAPDLLRAMLPKDVRIVSGGVETTLRLLREHAEGIESDGSTAAPKQVDVAWDVPDLEALDLDFSVYATDPDFQYQLDTQIGCPYRCFHCGTGRPGLIARTIGRPLESLRAELDYVIGLCRAADVPPPKFWVTDETFSADVDRAKAVCELLGAYEGIQWRAQTRADCIDADMLSAMHASGCVSLAFGVEVPSDAGLALFGKREEMGRVSDAFRMTREAGLRAEAILVFGAPGDHSSFDDVFDTLEHLNADSLQSYIYHPVPGSPWWRKHGSSLTMTDVEAWSRLDFHSPLVTPCTTDEADDTIARFVGSLVWSRRSEAVPKAALWRQMLEQGYDCPDCGSFVRPMPLRRHGPIDVAMLSNDDKRLFVAVGQEEVVAYCSSDAHENIHSRMRFLLDESMEAGLSHLCQCCGVLAGSDRSLTTPTRWEANPAVQ